MSSHSGVVGTGTIKIANGGTTSGTLTDTAANNGAALSDGQLKVLKTARSLTIAGPSALTGAVKVEVTIDGSNWHELNQAGSDVSVAANDAVTITNMAWLNLRVKSAGAEGAERVFRLMANYDTAK